MAIKIEFDKIISFLRNYDYFINILEIFKQYIITIKNIHVFNPFEFLILLNPNSILKKYIIIKSIYVYFKSLSLKL